MAAYYNEFDQKAAAWLRELIARGLIAPGDVDDRSILDVRPSDLVGFTQCHFFAGIGGWSYALRLAGWPDDRPVWTGSPPCQPFSVAGARKGQDDERHLAPHFVELVRACRPPVLFGEQVASSAVFGKAASGSGKRTAGAPEWAWFDDLSDRLEAARYAVGASDLPAASVGAPHIRQRAFFGAVATEGLEYAECEQRQRRGAGQALSERGPLERVERRGDSGWLADAACERHDRLDSLLREAPRGRDAGGVPETAGGGADDRLADAKRRTSERHGHEVGGTPRGHQGGKEERKRLRDDAWNGDAVNRLADADDTGPQGRAGVPERADQLASRQGGVAGRPGPDDSPWGVADWLYCRDGKWRPVEPGTSPLAHGVSARVGRLRGYGNAIVPQVAAAFIDAFSAAMQEAAE